MFPYIAIRVLRWFSFFAPKVQRAAARADVGLVHVPPPAATKTRLSTAYAICTIYETT